MKSVTENGHTVNLPTPNCSKCEKKLTYGEWDYNDRLRSFGSNRPLLCRKCNREIMKEKGWGGEVESIVV